MPYEFCRATIETNFGTTKTTPTEGTETIPIRLTGANAFTMRPMLRQNTIARSGGFAARGFTVADRWSYAGTLRVELCYSQAALLLGWAITRINSGRTTPWTTSGTTVGNLASMTLYHGITRSDGTVKRTKYLGCMVTRWRLSFTADSPIAILTLDLLAQKHAGNADDSSSDPDATEFAAIADSSFATDPVLYTHLSGSGGLSIGGSEVSCVYGATLTGENAIDARYCTSKFLTFAEIRGRNVGLEAAVRFTASPNWRSLFDAQTVQTVEMVVTNGTTTVTFDMYDSNIITGVTDDLQPGRTYDQNLTIASQWDTTTNEGDIALTVA